MSTTKHSQTSTRRTRHRSLGELEQILLVALLQLNKGAYGVSIRTFVAERTGRTLSPGAVYTAMSRLERRGLVKSRLGEPTAQRGGKRKRAYELTPDGLEAVATSYRNLRAMAAGVEPQLETQLEST